MARVVDISYAQASQNIDNHRDVSVRWGSVIIDVENEENFSLVQAFSYASEFGHLEVVRILLVKGANVNLADNNGTTPFGDGKDAAD